MASKVPFSWDSFSPLTPAHRATLAAQSPAELAKLVMLEVEGLGDAAYFLADEDDNLDAALRVYDALLKAPLDTFDPRDACNATHWLAAANEHTVDAARSARYLKRWARLARENPALYLNLAMLETQLKEPVKAVALLREGLEQGAPKLREQLASRELQALRKTPGFSALKTIKPVYPTALRELQLALCITFDDDFVEAGVNADLESIQGTLDSKGVAELYELTPATAREFLQFGSSGDGGIYAFWRKGQLPLEQCPVVYFGSDGLLGVLATDLVGFLVLFAHGVGASDAESWGFTFGEWALETTSGAPSFKANKPVLKQLTQWLPAVAKRAPRAEWKAVLALAPDFLRRIQSGART